MISWTGTNIATHSRHFLLLIHYKFKNTIIFYIKLYHCSMICICVFIVFFVVIDVDSMYYGRCVIFMPFLTWVTVSQETWYSWSFLNIYKLQVEFCLWERTNVSKMKPTMLASTSHTLTTSWSFCNLLVWAVFCMINLRKHSFEFEDYKKPIMLFLLLTISLLPFQNIFVRATLFLHQNLDQVTRCHLEQPPL